MTKWLVDRNQATAAATPTSADTTSTQTAISSPRPDRSLLNDEGPSLSIQPAYFARSSSEMSSFE